MAEVERYSPICPLTVDRPVMLHRWERLTFLHWAYEPALVQRLLPPGLSVETFNGFAELDQGDELRDVQVPALLAWGDRDAFTGRAAQQELLALLGDARLEVYEGAGHAVHWDQPLRFARDVAAFSRYSAALQLSRSP